jgi:hypothetical protein
MSPESWSAIGAIASALAAAVALVISLRALRLERDLRVDMEGGTHSITYREHVWFLHDRGLTVQQIEAILKRESLEPGMDLAEGDAYLGRLKTDGTRERGYKIEVGSVAEILGEP